MQKRKIFFKILVTILIFNLTYLNFAIVTEAYASSFAEAIWGAKSNTGSKNVNFDAFFMENNQKLKSINSDVNNNNLSINLELNVENEGYLDDCQISIVEKEESRGLNFSIKDSEELPQYVQLIDGNIIYLQQIKNSEDVVIIEVPIEYENKELFDENNISKDFDVIFSGIYKDGKGKETEVSKKEELKLSWNDKREATIETSIEKYIDFGEGVILQTKIKIDNSSQDEDKKNSLPLKRTEINIEPPEYMGVFPNSMNVVANSTVGTNGRDYGETIFKENDWEYYEENNLLKILVENPVQYVEDNEFKDEFLKEAETDFTNVPRYYNKPGIDEFLITYTYYNVEIPEEEIVVSANIDAKLITLDIENETYEENESTDELSQVNKYEYALNGSRGELVSLSKETETINISKAHCYVNQINYDKEEIAIDSKMIINISNKDIVEKLEITDVKNSYMDKEGNLYINNDIYYKNIQIQYENFVSILGEAGQIQVLDSDDNVIGNINSESEITSDGEIGLLINDEYDKLKLETTKPISDGNLVIKTEKAFQNISMDKNSISSLEGIITETSLQAEYSYVDEEVEIERVRETTRLEDTETTATLRLDRENLSTLEENRDVEIRIELNNAREESDIYGYTEFEIEFPECIESVEVVEQGIIVGEGLEIVSVEVLENNNIKVIVDGKQEGINTGVLTNGTNVILTANIEVNKFAPKSSKTIKLKTRNSEATNSSDEIVTEIPINIISPVGLIAVSNIYNYNGDGSYTTSISSTNNDKKVALIDVYSTSKTVKEDILIINNYSNSVSDIKILGRIPFKGAKDEYGNVLGNTLDCKMTSQIISNEDNSSEFTIYYSYNGEATQELYIEENGWISASDQEINLEEVKSYLIVPNDENYELNSEAILKFTYQYEIPSNLPHNEYIYSTYGVHYKNHSEVAVTDEIAIPNIIEITTGAGPELELSVDISEKTVFEGQKFELYVTAMNQGESYIEDVEVELEYPQGATSDSYQIIKGEKISQESVWPFIVKEKRLEPGEKVEFTITLTAQDLPLKIEERTATSLEEIPESYRGTAYEIDENNYTYMIVTDEIEKREYNYKVKATAKDLGTILEKDSNNITINPADVKIIQGSLKEKKLLKPNEEIEVNLNVFNAKNDILRHLNITSQMPEELTFVKTYGKIINITDNSSQEFESGHYDENLKQLMWSIDELAPNEYIQLKVVLKANLLEEGLSETISNFFTEVVADGIEKHSSGNFKIRIGRPILNIRQESSTENAHIKIGDEIQYVFAITNEGSVETDNVILTDKLPEGVYANSVSYNNKVGNVKKSIDPDKEINVEMNIEPQETISVNILAVAGNANNSAINIGSISEENLGISNSNEILHIIDSSEEKEASKDSSIDPNIINKPTTIASGSGNTKYSISGMAWQDSNRDGLRSSGEPAMTGLNVSIIESKTGKILKNQKTDSSGQYTFSNLENGNYIVLMDFDSEKFKLTTYQKSGVASKSNNDFFANSIEQEGKNRTGAITNVITILGESVVSIDAGFVLADIFDLEIDKTITKVTVQTSKETTTNNYNNVKLIKTEIAAKNLAGSTVYVEYEIKVTNVGDIKGYAKKIVDYLPEGMTFNSSIGENSKWYTGSDGNLYTEGLANKELAKGQSAVIKLVLTRKMTEENTDIVSNQAEIYEAYNKNGIEDINSKPANKIQSENDFSKADIAIMVKTGEELIYASVIMTTVSLGIIVVFIVYTQITLMNKLKRNEE